MPANFDNQKLYGNVSQIRYLFIRRRTFHTPGLKNQCAHRTARHYSNEICKKWSWRSESNGRPADYKHLEMAVPGVVSGRFVTIFPSPSLTRFLGRTLFRTSDFCCGSKSKIFNGFSYRTSAEHRTESEICPDLECRGSGKQETRSTPTNRPFGTIGQKEKCLSMSRWPLYHSYTQTL